MILALPAITATQDSLQTFLASLVHALEDPVLDFNTRTLVIFDLELRTLYAAAGLGTPEKDATNVRSTIGAIRARSVVLVRSATAMGTSIDLFRRAVTRKQAIAQNVCTILKGHSARTVSTDSTVMPGSELVRGASVIISGATSLSAPAIESPDNALASPT